MEVELKKVLQPAAKLQVEDKSYELVFDYNAIADAEALTGCNLLHGVAALLVSTVSAAQLRGLLYAALKPRQPEMTLAAAGALISIERLPVIYQALGEAWQLSLPNPPVAGGVPAVS